jgi:Ion transport protein
MNAFISPYSNHILSFTDPIITYSWPARIVNFCMIIAAVGVVAIPSGLIANGFVTIVQSKNKARRRESRALGGRAGDDWYEISYRGLEGTRPPRSRFGPVIDQWQYNVDEFLNGRKREDGTTEWPNTFAFASRVFIFMVIIANVIAVLLESIPWIDKAVGNQQGNIFDRFEFFSVMIFALEYILRLFCAPKNREALYSSFVYATTFFGIVDLLSTAPWFIEHALIALNLIDKQGDTAKIFRIFRIFRILQLEDFVVAFSKLDNVFRASKDVLKATGLLAIIIWVGCGALFYIFEENNPNWRECDESIPPHSFNISAPGCFDFASTADCNAFYPGMCKQTAFVNMPNALYYTAVFLGGEWGVVDFTWPGRLVCLFLCVVGIGLYAIPVGTLFDSFGAVLGMGGDDD